MSHTIVWFEVPVTNLKRAMSFYSKVLDVEIEHQKMGEMEMGIFPGGKNTEMPVVHGALVQSKGCTPSKDGATVYFNAGNDLSPALSRVESAGGKVITHKTSIGQHGFFAIFEDTEGNHQALHSPN